MKRHYVECSHRDMKIVVSEIMEHFSRYPLQSLFKKCGYIQGGRFDPTVELENDLKTLGFEDNSEKQREFA